MYLALSITPRPPRHSRSDEGYARTSEFSYASEILEKHGSAKLKLSGTAGQRIVPSSGSESNRNSTTHGTASGTNFQHRLAVADPRLEVQQIACVDDRLGPNGQSKRGQILGHLNAQRRIVDRQTAGKRIDGEYGRLRRKAK